MYPIVPLYSTRDRFWVLLNSFAKYPLGSLIISWVRSLFLYSGVSLNILINLYSLAFAGVNLFAHTLLSAIAVNTIKIIPTTKSIKVLKIEPILIFATFWFSIPRL